MPHPLCFEPALSVVAVSCLVAFMYFLLPNRLQIPGGDVTVISLSAEEVDQLRSVYLPLFPLSLSKEERDEWVALVSMPVDELEEKCRLVDDPEFVHIYDAMLTRAKRERLDTAVVQQLRVDFATFFSVDACTAEDLSFEEMPAMPNVLEQTIL